MRELLNELFSSTQKFHVAGLATTEAEARLWLSEHPSGWDLAIVDLILAEGAGFGVIERARQTAPNSAIIVFSGYITPGVAEHCHRLGATAIIDKAEANGLLAWLDAFQPP